MQGEEKHVPKKRIYESWFTPAQLGSYCSLKLEFLLGWSKECNWSNPSLTTPYCPHKFLKKFEKHCSKRMDGKLMDYLNKKIVFRCYPSFKCNVLSQSCTSKEMQKWRYRKCYPSSHPLFQLRSCIQLLVLLVCIIYPFTAPHGFSSRFQSFNSLQIQIFGITIIQYPILEHP